MQVHNTLTIKNAASTFEFRPNVRRRHRCPLNTKPKPRRGVILLIVVVVIAAFSVAAYSFTHLMLTELSVVQAQNKAQQQRLLAQSGIEQLLNADAQALGHLAFATIPGSRPSAASNANPAFATVRLSSVPPISGQYAILKELPKDGESPKFGLQDESAKLNLNSLVADKYSRKEVVAKLMKYDGLREATAEGIADLLGVLDVDINAEETPTRKPLGGLLRSFDQLLTVSGVTEQLLYNEDRNGNGLLDSNEDDGEDSFPPDNSDGKLDAGWSAHWTLTGAESNFRQDSRLKINLNQPDLVSLYDELIEFATPEEARFVVAWRKSSPTYTDVFSDADRLSSEEIAELRRRTLQDRIRRQMGMDEGVNAIEPVISRNGRDTMRAGLDLGVRASRQFKSLLDLASCQLQIIIDGEDTVLVSPFANDPASLERWLPLWERRATVAEGPVQLGRINVMQASMETLQTIKGISPQLAQQIALQRTKVSERSQQNENSQLTIGWLLEAGLVTTPQLRKMASEISVGGSVFRGIVLGQLDNSRTATGIYFEIDGISSTLQLRRSIDLPPMTNGQRLTSR